ncbi:MAG TPA: hypothetical protein VK400_15945 [Pyrinomonadaceae bacterium]|nr:hypothetical protein [Pyrinomonadaceae bacterium]
MKKSSILTAAFLIVFALGAQAASAQITITLPQFPKIKKPKPDQTRNDSTNGNNQSNRNSANGDGQTKESKNTTLTGNCAGNIWVESHLEDIAKRQKEVEGFTPDRGWLVNSSNYDHLLYAVSPAAREKWLAGANALGFRNCLASAFDKLAASAATKLPLFLPNTKAYAQHNPAEERLMKSKINDLADHKIFYIGMREPSWLIDKNEYGLPKSRYKHGMVWVRYTPNDHPYCRVYYINIIQDYAGGGTYGAGYASFIEEQLVGCPTVAK